MGTEPNYVDDAILALTAAARGSRTVGAGTGNEHQEQVDFAEIACHVLTAVAANLGGPEALLAGRPGSWEADLIRQVIQGVAGKDPTGLAGWHDAVAGAARTDRRPHQGG